MTPDIFDTRLIDHRRSRWADHARAQDFLLRRAGEDLAERLSMVKRRFSTAVILGAHHGILHQELARTGQIDTLISAESSWRLVQDCKPPKLLFSQEYLPFQNASCDLIVSPLIWQLANDLPGILVQIRRALKNDGLLLATLLGGDSLHELRQAWLMADAELSNGAGPRVAPFIDIRDMGSLLQRAGFALPVVDNERLTVTYASPLALMQELKAMGTSNPMIERSRKPVSKRLLKRAAEIYSELYSKGDKNRIVATFDILTVSAWAPDASQQKPLPPGSAKTRLADVLGTREFTIPSK